MASTTPSLRKPDLLRRLLCCLGLLLVPLSTAAQGIHVKSAELAPNAGEYYLSANFELDLNPTLEEALNRGVPLHFVVEFELILPRWYTLYLWNRRVAGYEQRYRLSYNALTRQYRVSLGALHQSFDTLEEALALVGRFTRRRMFSTDELGVGKVYEAQIRMRLDTGQLPKPFQIDAIGSRDWNLSSNWYRWTVTP
jgi:hypothetical protein